MANISKSGLYWSGVHAGCDDISISSLGGKLRVAWIVSSTGTYLVDGDPGQLLPSWPDITCGTAFALSSEQGVNYELSNGTFVQTGSDFGRVDPNFPSTIKIQNLSGDYAIGNGDYILTTSFTNFKPSYLNKINGWTITYNLSDSSWWLWDETGNRPALKNPELGPVDGAYEDPECTDNCQTGVPLNPAAPNPPVVPVLTSPPSLNNDTTPTWSWVLGSTDTTEFSYQIDSSGWITVGVSVTSFTPESPLSDGSHTFELKALNAAALESEVVSSTIVIDTTAPGVPQPTSATPTNDTTPTWKWPAVADAAQYQVYIGDELMSSGMFTEWTKATPMSEGSHTIKVRAKDTAENWSAYGEHTVVIDTTAPGVPQPTSATPTNDTTPTWNWPAVAAAAQYQVYIGDELMSSGMFTEWTKATPMSEGSHTIKVRAKDVVGNWSDYGEHTVVIDTTAPTAAVSGAPTEPIAEGTQVSLTIGGTDVTHFKYKLDAESWGAEWPIGTAINYTSNTGSAHGVALGTHTFSVIGRDEVGNWQAEASATTVTWEHIDVTPPSAPTFTSQPSSPTNDTTPIWTWNAPSGATHFAYQQSNNNGSSYSGWSGWFTTPSYSPTLTQDATYKIQIKCKDSADNESGVTTSNSFVLDRAAPAAPTITGPLGLCPNGTWQPLWEACQLSDMGIAKNVTLSYSYMDNGTICDWHREVGFETGLGEPSVQLEQGIGVNEEQFRSDIVEAFQEWKELIEAEFPNVTITFQDLGYETSNNVPSAPYVSYDLPHPNNIGDIRIGMHKIHGLINPEDTALGHAIILFPRDKIGVSGTGGGDVHFDSDVTWRLDESPTSSSSYSIKLITAHEIGHSLGLGGHLHDSNSALMKPGANASDAFRLRFPNGLKGSPADTENFRHEYESEGPFSAVFRGDSQLEFDWKLPSEANESYECRVDTIDVSTGNITDGTWTTDGIGSPPHGRTFTWTPPALGNNYYSKYRFSVRSTDSAGNTGSSAQLYVYLLSHPVVPTGLTADIHCPTDGSAHINGGCYDANGLYQVKTNWAPSPPLPNTDPAWAVFFSEKNAGYDVRDELVNIATGEKNAYIKQLPGGKEHDFHIRVYDEGLIPTGHEDKRGWEYGLPSSTVSHTTPAVPDTTAPPAIVLSPITPYQSSNPNHPVGELLVDEVWKPAVRVEWQSSSEPDLEKYLLLISELSDFGGYSNSDLYLVYNAGIETDWTLSLAKYNTTYYAVILTWDTNSNHSKSNVVSFTTVVENPAPVMPSGDQFPIGAYAWEGSPRYNEYPDEKWKLRIGVPYATDSQWTGTGSPDVEAEGRNDYSKEQWISMIGHLPYRLECKQWHPQGNDWGYGFFVNRNETSGATSLQTPWEYNGANKMTIVADDFEASTTCEFRVRAYDTSGKSSDWLHQNITTGPLPSDHTAWPTPTDLSVSHHQFVNGGEYADLQWGLDVSWDPVWVTLTDLKHFKIHYKAGTSGTVYYWTVEPEGALPTTSRKYRFARNTTYYFRIQSEDTSGNKSRWSDWVPFTTGAGDTSAPASPTSLVAISASASKVLLSWPKSSSSDVLQYVIYYTSNSAHRNGNYYGNYTKAYVTDDGRDTYNINITGLAEGTLYWFQIGCYDHSHNYSTNYSPEASATPLGVTPTAPHDLKHWIPMDITHTNLSAGSGTSWGNILIDPAVKDIKHNDFFVATWGEINRAEIASGGVAFNPHPGSTNGRWGSTWTGYGGSMLGNYQMVMGRLNHDSTGTLNNSVAGKPYTKLSSQYTISFWIKATKSCAQAVLDINTYISKLKIETNFQSIHGVAGKGLSHKRSSSLQIRPVNVGDGKSVWYMDYGHNTRHDVFSPQFAGGSSGTHPTTYAILDKGGDYDIGPINLDDLQWHHFSIHVDGDGSETGTVGKCSIVIDNTSLYSATILPFIQDLASGSSTTLANGSHIELNERGTGLFIDDLRIYNKYLSYGSTGEIQSIKDGDFPASWDQSSTPVNTSTVDTNSTSSDLELQKDATTEEIEELKKHYELKNFNNLLSRQRLPSIPETDELIHRMKSHQFEDLSELVATDDIQLSGGDDPITLDITPNDFKLETDISVTDSLNVNTLNDEQSTRRILRNTEDINL